MKPWWLTDYGRLASELASLATVRDEGWFVGAHWHLHNELLAVVGVIVAHGVEYPVRLIFPDLFPLVPAWVTPQDPQARWSSHQYGKGGALCLELRPDNWQPSATGVDVLRSAYNLLRQENPLGYGNRGEVPSEHRVGLFERYATGIQPVLVSEGCLRRIREGTVELLKGLRWLSDSKVFPTLVYDAVDAAGAAPPPASIPWASIYATPVLVKQCANPLEPSIEREQIAEALSAEPDSEATPVLVFAVNENTVVAHMCWRDGTVIQRGLLLVPDDAGIRTGRASPESNVRIAIVGVGSIGSKVAESLCRTGNVCLMLVDGDVMLPGNLERHSLDWRDVGFQKVEAMRRRLTSIRTNANVIPVPISLNWQLAAPAYAGLVSVLEIADIVVDATGHVPTSLLLGAVATKMEKPFVSVEVFEGGIGCMVARSVPGRDPAYAYARERFYAFCDERNIEAPKSGTGRYDALGVSGDVVVADDASVTVAAGHATRVVLDVLNDTLEDDSAAWMLIGLRRAWLFSGHGHTIGLEIARPTTGGATDGDPPPDEVERAREFALALTQASRDEAPNRT